MTWQEVALFGPAPSPRRLHAAVPASGRLLFFGGAPPSRFGLFPLPLSLVSTAISQRVFARPMLPACAGFDGSGDSCEASEFDPEQLCWRRLPDMGPALLGAVAPLRPQQAWGGGAGGDAAAQRRAGGVCGRSALAAVALSDTVLVVGGLADGVPCGAVHALRNAAAVEGRALRAHAAETRRAAVDSLTPLWRQSCSCARRTTLCVSVARSAPL